MQSQTLNRINDLFQQEVERINLVYDKELEERARRINDLEADLSRMSTWKIEKKELLDKINQLEQYSNISLVRAYDTKLSKRNKEVEQLEQKNKYLNTLFNCCKLPTSVNVLFCGFTIFVPRLLRVELRTVLGVSLYLLLLLPSVLVLA